MHTPLKINGLIISAGLSGRINTFKPLADYKGKPFIHNIVSKLNTICDKITIVTGFHSEELQNELINSLNYQNQSEIIKKINFTINESFEKGMFGSLQKGISETDPCDWILYHFVDQPGLPDVFYSEFIGQIDSNYDWIQPLYQGRRGHPVLFGRELFGLIADSMPDSSLREISNYAAVKKKFWNCIYPEIFQDIDTDEDYLKLQQNTT